MPGLHKYERRDVAQVGARVTRAGDGLSDAMTIEPREYSLGEKVYLLLETEVARIAYEPIKDTDVLRRVHTLATVTGTTIDVDQAEAVLELHRIAVEESKGVHRLDLDGDDEDDAGEPEPAA